MLIGWEREVFLYESLALSLAIIEIAEKSIDIDMLKIECGHLYFVLFKNIPVGNYAIGTVRPHDVVDAVDAL